MINLFFYDLKRTVTSVAMGISLSVFPSLYAQTLITTAVAQPEAKQPQRLSTVLLQEAKRRQEQHQPDMFLFGIRWTSQAELTEQSKQKNDLLNQLEKLNQPVLYERIRTLPVTGRIVLPEQDPRWLQANPTLDPFIEQTDAIVIPDTINTVAVLREDGSLCEVSHQHRAEAHDYINRCVEHEKLDWAWIIQANGAVQQVGIATWNRSKQDEPSPGSWIWAPSRHSSWPQENSLLLAHFISTQGPSGTPEVKQQFGLESDITTSHHAIPSNDYRQTNVSLFSSENVLSKGRDFQPTSSDWGTIGLLQTPTARMEKAGNLSFTYSNVYPYTRNSIFLQPVDWFEFGFRYTSISNRLYGPIDFSGTQSYKDKSIDAKIRFWQESAYLPELALGFRDLAGTGGFSGEYIVGNKRTGNFDWSLGIGWGYLGTADTIKNPLSLISSTFNTRLNDVGNGGTLSSKAYFRGPAALFGGVQYQTPWDSLLLKLELDSNNYQHELLNNNQKRSSPINVGAIYRWTPNIDIKVGLERGNVAALGFTLHEHMNTLFTPKISMPRPIPVAIKSLESPSASAEPLPPLSASNSLPLASSPALASTSPSSSYTNTISDIEDQTHWRISEIRRQNATWIVTVIESGGFLRERLDRIIAVLHRDALTEITQFHIQYQNVGSIIAEHHIDRKQWMLNQTRLIKPSEKKEAITLTPETTTPTHHSDIDSTSGDSLPTILATSPEKRFKPSVGIHYQQTLGGPDGFLLYSFAAEASAKLNLWKGGFISGAVDARLIDNYDKFKTTGGSDLPRVRTYLREYLTTSRFTLPNLQATHIAKLSDSQFVSAYGGYLEPMFAGVGGEYLWRPTNSHLALGFNINRVQQRAFEQNFNLMDYKVTTGHATAYWDTGWNDLQLKASVGQYLAGDKGVTVDLRRVFKNGVTMGVFVTKTNVSATQFGEGSFNKGIYFSFPFDLITTNYSASRGTVLWTPLTRDGGAELNRTINLYDYTSTKDPRGLEYKAQ